MIEITNTIWKVKRILFFTDINKFVIKTSPTIIPVDAIKDIIKTICDFSGSNKYAHGKLIPPASKVALIPIEPYKHRE